MDNVILTDPKYFTFKVKPKEFLHFGTPTKEEISKGRFYDIMEVCYKNESSKNPDTDLDELNIAAWVERGHEDGDGLNKWIIDDVGYCKSSEFFHVPGLPDMQREFISLTQVKSIMSHYVSKFVFYGIQRVDGRIAIYRPNEKHDLNSITGIWTYDFFSSVVDVILHDGVWYTFFAYMNIKNND